MKKKSIGAAALALLALLCALHIFVSPRRFRSGISISPAWVLDVAAAKGAGGAGEDAIPFRLGNFVGLFSPDGKMISKEEFGFQATISAHYSAVYEEDSERFVLKGRASQTEVEASGFPFVQDDRCYVFLPGGNSVCQIDAATGAKKWTLDGYSPITAFRSSSGAAVAGFADGELVCVDEGGAKIASFYPGGSEMQVVSNADISPDSSMVAAVCGLERQRIILARVSRSQSKIFFHRYLSGNLRERAFVRFSKDGGTVLFSSPNGLGIVDVGTQRMTEINMAGKIVDAAEVAGTDVCAVLLKKSGSFEVALIEGFRDVVGKFGFESQNAFVAAGEKMLFVGSGSQISALEISKK